MSEVERQRLTYEPFWSQCTALLPSDKVIRIDSHNIFYLYRRHRGRVRWSRSSYPRRNRGQSHGQESSAFCQRQCGVAVERQPGVCSRHVVALNNHMTRAKAPKRGKKWGCQQDRPRNGADLLSMHLLTAFSSSSKVTLVRKDQGSGEIHLLKSIQRCSEPLFPQHGSSEVDVVPCSVRCLRKVSSSPASICTSARAKVVSEAKQHV